MSRKSGAKNRFIRFCFAAKICSSDGSGGVKGINSGNYKAMISAMKGNEKAQKKIKGRAGLIGINRHGSVAFGRTEESGIPMMAGKKLKSKGLAKNIERYTNQTFRELNKQLRAGSTAKDVSAITKKINAAISSAPKAKERVLTRGVNIDADKLMFSGKLVTGLKKGSTIKVNEFLSTSASQMVSNHFSGGKTLIRIKPKRTKTKAVNVEKYSSDAAERERLFPAGTNFKLGNVKKNKKGTTIINLFEL